MSRLPSSVRLSAAGLAVCLLVSVRPALAQEPVAAHAESAAQVLPRPSFSKSISLSLAVPLTGGFNVGWSVPVSSRLVVTSFLAYFDRDWLVFIEPSDWHSYSGYIGTALQYFPTGQAGSYEGFFLGADIGLAISYQTYKPVNEGDLFFFPFIDLYFFGYDLPIWRGLHAQLYVGGGYAPVGPIVKVDGYTHDGGDFYPVADLRLAYRW